MALTTKILASVVAEQTNPLDLGSGAFPLTARKAIDLASGTGANQADRLWSDQRTLAASATEDLDLAGVLADAFGATVTFAKVKSFYVFAATANTNNVVVGGQTTNGWLGPFGAAAHTIAVPPGGVLLAVAPAAAGWAVTAGTGDLLKVTNSAAGSAVTYDIVIVGTSLMATKPTVLLSKDAILAADDLPFEDVDVPEWGGTVRLRTLTGTERDAFEAGMWQQIGKHRRANINNIRARLLSLCLVDESGTRLFVDSEVKALGAKSSKALDRLFDAARDLNGLSDDDVDKMAEGFDNAQSDSSTTD